MIIEDPETPIPELPGNPPLWAYPEALVHRNGKSGLELRAGAGTPVPAPFQALVIQDHPPLPLAHHAQCRNPVIDKDFAGVEVKALCPPNQRTPPQRHPDPPPTRKTHTPVQVRNLPHHARPTRRWLRTVLMEPSTTLRIGNCLPPRTFECATTVTAASAVAVETKRTGNEKNN